jgi:hypothetical protein
MTSPIESINVPEDFPRKQLLGAVGGMAPKLLLVRTADGKFAAPTISEDERRLHWQNCEDLASQLADAAMRSKCGKRSDWREEDILDQYLPRLQKTGWVTEEESIWILRRTATILAWPLPESLQV